MNISYINQALPTDTYNGVKPKESAIDTLIPSAEDIEVRSSSFAGTFSSVSTTGAKVDVSDVENMEAMLEAKATLAKENLTNLLNKLTISDVKEMDDRGLGSINDTELEETVNVVEEIKIMLATYCEDYIPTGNLDVDKVKEVTGSVTLTTKVMKKLSENNFPVTRDNVMDVTNAVSELNAIDGVTEGDKRYLIRNNMAPTIDNIYKAKHSGGTRGNALDATTIESMRPQIEGIISKSGYSVDEKTFANAKMILEEGQALDERSLALAERIDNLTIPTDEDGRIDKAIEGLFDDRKPADAILGDNDTLFDRVTFATDVLKRAGIEEVMDVLKNGKELTVNNLGESLGNAVATDNASDENVFDGVKVLNQARISLSAGTLLTMEKLGIDTLNMPLNELVDAYEGSSEANEVMLAAGEIKEAPVVALSAFANVSYMSLEDIRQEAVSLKWKMDVAKTSYDTFGTEIRRDLGDNLNKAVDSSVRSLLSDMNLSDNSSNVAAVKILSFANLEVNVESTTSMASDFAATQNVVNNISPKMVLDMIRTGRNPLKMDIHELSDEVSKYNENDTTDDGFAKFLYKLERDNSISEDERRDYIGMYKIFNTISRDEAKSIGEVLKGNGEITLNNLITAYTSRRHSGIDASLGENTEFRTGSGDIAFFKELFETPVADGYYENTISEVNEATMTDEAVIRLLTDNNLSVTVSNIMAAKEFKSGRMMEKLFETEDEEVNNTLNSMINSEDEEALKENVAKISDRVNELSKNAVESIDITYEKIRVSQSLVKNVSLMVGLSDSHQYQIPVSVDGKKVNVNLKLLNGNGAGKMSITFNSEKTGNVSISCKATDTSIEALCLSDNSETVEMIKARKDAIIERLTEEGFSKASVTEGISKEMLELSGTFVEGTASTKDLYKAAKIFISHILTN